MSLLPLILDEVQRPLRLFDQHFGVGLDPEDMIAPLNLRSLLRTPHGYIRPWSSAKSGSGSTIMADKDKFQVNLDVQQFHPEEITVKASGDNCIVIEGKHEEKPDEHGYISRHFVRKYMVPKGHDINQVISHLSSDGVLTITAPKVDKSGDAQRVIPIQQTGAPHKALKKDAEAEPKK